MRSWFWSASGGGKSTFLRCINHLEKIDGGFLFVDGGLVGYKLVGTRLHELRDREICARRAEIGMVFQHFNLFPHLTALQNVIEAPVGVRRGSSVRRQSEHAPCLPEWVCRIRPMSTRISFRAASSSGSRSPRVGHAAEADAFRRAHLRP